MKAKELLHLLSNLSSQSLEKDICFVYSSRDYWKTQIAKNVRNIDFEGVVKYSDYHEANILAEPDDQADRLTQETIKEVILIKG